MMRITPYPKKEQIIETHTSSLKKIAKMPDRSLWALDYIPYMGNFSGNISLGHTPDGMKAVNFECFLLLAGAWALRSAHANKPAGNKMNHHLGRSR